MNNLTNYERIASRFGKGYITVEQLKRYVKLGVVTAEQFKELSGEDYPAESTE